MGKNTLKLNESELRMIVSESVNGILKEWMDDSSSYYPGKFLFNVQSKQLSGDMDYEINDVAELSNQVPDKLTEEIVEYFEYDYPQDYDEEWHMKEVFFVCKGDEAHAYDDIYYISSLDEEYAEEIKAAISNHTAVKNLVIIKPKINVQESKNIKLNESQLNNIIAESIKNLLKGC